jgi:hypothetical protein
VACKESLREKITEAWLKSAVGYVSSFYKLRGGVGITKKMRRLKMIWLQ